MSSSLQQIYLQCASACTFCFAFFHEAKTVFSKKSILVHAVQKFCWHPAIEEDWAYNPVCEARYYLCSGKFVGAPNFFLIFSVRSLRHISESFRAVPMVIVSKCPYHGSHRMTKGECSSYYRKKVMAKKPLKGAPASQYIFYQIV